MTSNSSAWPFLLDFVPEECLQTAEEELRETPETKNKALEDMNSKVKDSKILKDITFEPDYLVQFLRVSKFNVEVAFSRLKKYINFRRKHPSFYTGVGDKISSNSSYSWMTPLPCRSKDGCSVLVLKFGMWNPNDKSYEDLMRIIHLHFHQSLRNPVAQIKGFQLILDFKGTTLRHTAYATPGNLLQVAQMYLECNPARFKNFHCVNGTLTMKLAWAVIAPFMSEKLRNRVIFHKNPEHLLKYIDKETLPVEYGGELENYYMHEWLKESNHQMSISTLGGQNNIF